MTSKTIEGVGFAAVGPEEERPVSFRVRRYGPTHNPIVYVIEDWSGCGMYGFEEEPNALEHFRRHLEGEAPLAPYDGSRRRPRVWKKARLD